MKDAGGFGIKRLRTAGWFPSFSVNAVWTLVMGMGNLLFLGMGQW
jgi:hypothetical protein